MGRTKMFRTIGKLTCYTLEVEVKLILLCDWNLFLHNGLDIEVYDLRPAYLHYYYYYRSGCSLLLLVCVSFTIIGQP